MDIEVSVRTHTPTTYWLCFSFSWCIARYEHLVIILHNTLLFQEYFIFLSQIQFLLVTLHVLEMSETLLFESVEILHALLEIFVSS